MGRSRNLVPNEKLLPQKNSDHEIHKEQPQVVIAAIREVVEAARKGRLQFTQSVNPRPDLVHLRWMAVIDPGRAHEEVVSQFWWRAAYPGCRE